MKTAELERHDVTGVVGDLRVVRQWHSPALARSFDVTVWLPKDYDAQPRRRWPVVYFCDGHNLYDPAESAFGGVWHADRALAAVGAIGIGVPCHPTDRLAEYSPALSPEAKSRFGRVGVEPRGDAYLSFLVDELKPAVDRALRTNPAPAATAVVGSSAGGVMALWAWASRPDVVGLAAPMSPALWLAGQPLLDQVARACRAGVRGRLAVDVGGREAEGELGRRYVEGADALVALLRTNPRAAVRYEYDSEAIHAEAAWSQRLPGALAFLLRDLTPEEN